MGLYDPGAGMAMANTAEELGRRYGITRDQADAFGYRSHKNAKGARDAGWFDEEIEPCCTEIEIVDRKCGIVYRVSVEDFKRLSFRTHGDNYERQLALALEYWQVSGEEAVSG